MTNAQQKVKTISINMHKDNQAYRSQETQYGHHVEATDFLHVHLHEKIHMQANFQTCNILYRDTQFLLKGEVKDVNCKI